MCAVSSYLWNVSSRESAGWGVRLLRLESRFHPFIALRPWLSNVISSAPLPNLDPCRFFSCSDTGLTRGGFQLSWLFSCSLCLVLLCSNQTYIYASRCVHWRFVVVTCSLSWPGCQSFHTLVVWFGPCNNLMRGVVNVFPCLEEEADAQGLGDLS